MRAPEADFEVSRIYWLGPLTICSAIAAVLATRWAGLKLVTVPRRFDPLGVGPTVVDTFVLVTIAAFVFTNVAASGHERPRRRYRVIAFVCLLVSFVPDLLMTATWPLKSLLMAEHVAAWLVTVELLTRLA
jgi:Family of unknown function (DUF6069)